MKKQIIYTLEGNIFTPRGELIVPELRELEKGLLAANFYIFEPDHGFFKSVNHIIDCLVEPRPPTVGRFEGTRRECKLYVASESRLEQFMEAYYAAHKDEFACLKSSA